MIERQVIQNRKGQRVVVVVEKSIPQKGIAFVMHGLGGNKDQPQIRAMIAPFLERKLTVVSFDTTNTFGESDGSFEDATITNYFADLTDVIDWASSQTWYAEPFYLVGHSLGGICTALFAEKHPDKVKAIAPLSTVVSETVSTGNHNPAEVAQWKKQGFREYVSSSGRLKRLKWSHYEDKIKYDLLPGAHKLTMPVLLLVGENDDITPLNDQKMLLNALPGKKEIRVIAGAPHTFKDPVHLAEIKKILGTWIDRMEAL